MKGDVGAHHRREAPDALAAASRRQHEGLEPSPDTIGLAVAED
jgi:hypothetical protein